MAKSIVLYGVLLGAVVCLCGYFAGVGVGEVRGLGYGVNTPSLTVILSGTQWSRKISPLTAETVRGIRYEALGNRASGVENKKTAVRSAEENLIRTQIKQIYSAEIGVREKTGNNDGERVEEYLYVTGLGKGYAWCASFVSWVFAEAGFPQPRTPWSPALFPKERVVWERGKAMGKNRSFAPLEDDKEPRILDQKPQTRILKPNISGLIPDPPATADIFGIYFANLKRIAHVGFVDEWGDKYVVTVEGNTNEAGNNEGDGVYKKRRLISSIYQVSDWVQGQERRIE